MRSRSPAPLIVLVAIVLAFGYAHSGALASAGSVHAPTRAARTAIHYAERQLGKPYLWGGTGPDAFDCSGLVMEAYRHAGAGIPRTSQQQWAWGPQVPPGKVRNGDLVFFAGIDGTTESPGHVGIVVSARRHRFEEAYATGFPIRIRSWRGRGAIGFTRPSAHH